MALVDSISVPHGTPLSFSHPRIDGGKPFIVSTGMNKITWPYRLNTQVTPSYGGQVVQVLSAYVDSLTFSGPTENNEQLRAIYTYFLRYMQIAGLYNRNEQGITFQYPERGWQFVLQVTKASAFRYHRDALGTEWQLTAEIVQDSGVNALSAHTMNGFTSAAFDPSMFNVGFNAEDPRVNPLSAINDDPGMAARLGDNFQALMGAWASGDFAHWAFDPTRDPKANKLKDSKTYWTEIFGTDYLVKNPNSGSGSQLLGAGAAISGNAHSTALDNARNEYARQLTARTGLDFGVVCAWVAQESTGNDPVTIGYNFLNCDNGITHSFSGVPITGLSPGGFAKFSNVNDAATEAAYFVMHMSNFKSIKDAAGKSPSDQLTAIANSPWDAGHYGGDGHLLVNTYNRIKSTIVGDNQLGSGLGARALNVALTQLGYTESGTNITKYGQEYGLNGQPWCIIFLTWCFKRVGSSFHYAAASAVLADAQAGRNGLSVVHDPQPGDVVIYNFPGGTTTDHGNFFEQWITSGHGTFHGVGGNQGNAVTRDTFPTSQVVAYIRVTQ